MLPKMPDIQLGAVRSHGAQVARFHMYDWLILLLLVALDVELNIIEPFHPFVGEDTMADLKYPLKSNTVPFWVIPIVAILLPVVVFIIYYFYRKDVYDLHGALLGTSLKNLRPQLDSFCFQMLESRSSTQPASSTANRQSAGLSEIDRIYLELENMRGMAEFTKWDASPSLDAMEGGRRY